MKVRLVESAERRGEVEFLSRGFRMVCPLCGEYLIAPVFRRHLDGTLSTDYLEHANCSARFQLRRNEIVDARWIPGAWTIK